MSTKHHGLFVYGLHLNIDDLMTMYKNHCQQEAIDLPFNDLMWKLYEDGIIEFEFNFTGEVFPLDLAGRPCWGNVMESYCSELLGYVQLSKQPTLLHGAYHDISVAVMELRNRMDGLLPDDFDYYGNLCLILGTYYG